MSLSNTFIANYLVMDLLIDFILPIENREYALVLKDT